MSVASVIGIAGAVRITRDANADRRPVRRAIAVLSMKNVSARQDHAWLSTALAEGINGTLGAGGQVRVVSGAAVAEMQQDLRPQPGIGLSRRELDEIGRNLGCDLILTGNYLASDGRVRVDMRLDDIKTGMPVATVSVSDDERKLPDLVASAGGELRSKLGLAPLLAGQTESARAAMSSNPDALRFYFLGLDALRVQDLARATELLTHAVEEDPDFALAHLDLALAWRVLGRDAESQAQARRAFELSPGLSREDQLSIVGTYYEVMSDFPKAVETFQSLWTFYPDDVGYGLQLFHSQLFAGRLADAGRVVDQMKTLPPPADRDARIALTEAEWLSRVGRRNEALAAAATAVDRARRAKSTRLQAAAMMTQGRSAQGLGLSADAAPLFAKAKTLYETVADAGGVADALRAQANLLLSQDSLDAAIEHADEALRIATNIQHHRSIVECWIVRSHVLRHLHRLAESRADAESAVAASRLTGYKSALGRALVALGSTERAQREASNARAHLEEAERIGREIGEPGLTTAAVNALAGLGR